VFSLLGLTDSPGMEIQLAACPPWLAPATGFAVQKTTTSLGALSAVVCSHVPARYPQAAPQFPGASEYAARRCAQGLAGRMQSFLLDPGSLTVHPGPRCRSGPPHHRWRQASNDGPQPSLSRV